MTDQEFFALVEAYKVRFLGPGEGYDYIFAWKPDLMPFAFVDAMAAIGDLGRDGSYASTKPRYHLPLLLEFCRDRRERSARKRLPPLSKTPRSEAWDKLMARVGAISKQEFAKRQRARKETA